MSLSVKLYLEIVEASIAFFYMRSLFSSKMSLFRRILWFALLYCINLMVFMIPQSFPFANVVSYFLINAFLIKKCYDRTWRSMLFHSALLTGTMILSEFIGMLIFGYIVNDISLFLQDERLYTIVTSFEKMVNFLFIYIEKNLLKKAYRHNYEISTKAWVFSVVPAASSLILCLFGAVLEDEGISRAQTGVFFAFAVFVTVATIVAALAYIWLNEREYENYLLRMEMNNAENRAEYSRKLEHFREEQRSIMHDLHNHLEVMRGLVEEGKLKEAEGYIATIAAFSESVTEKRFCENLYLNMLLQEFYEKCRKNNVELGTDTETAKLGMFTPEEIVSLFGNLLDNAYESAIQSWEKYVDVRIKEDSSELFVCIDNSCEEKPKTNKSGSMRSKKSDAEHHGIGMKSIEHILEKHHAEWKWYYDAETKSFHSIFRIGLNKASL